MEGCHTILGRALNHLQLQPCEKYLPASHFSALIKSGTHSSWSLPSLSCPSITYNFPSAASTSLGPSKEAEIPNVAANEHVTNDRRDLKCRSVIPSTIDGADDAAANTNVGLCSEDGTLGVNGWHWSTKHAAANTKKDALLVVDTITDEG